MPILPFPLPLCPICDKYTPKSNAVQVNHKWICWSCAHLVSLGLSIAESIVDLDDIAKE
jgi:hypothetical protein